MATTSGHKGSSLQELRREIETERERLVQALEALRRATDVTAAVRGRLPLLAAAAVAVGFVLSGGVGATMRLLARRGREGRTRARLGRYALVERE